MSVMAVVSGLEVPDELLQLFAALVRVVDAKRYGTVAKVGHLLSKEKKRNVSTRSLLPEISEYWKNLTVEEKAAWKAAGAASSYNMWNLFVQDTAYRLKYGITGLATPSTLYQYKVGKLTLAAPASGARLRQYHPESYYKMKKATGTKGLWTEVEIKEKLQLPLTIGMSYKANLTAGGVDSYARYYATIYSSYQGRTIETQVGGDLLQNTDWINYTATATEVIGKARSYDLCFDFNNVYGSFYWDNVIARHTGTNYARDWRCIDVNNELTRSNYQIEKSWEEEFLPTGVAFDSVYHTE